MFINWDDKIADELLLLETKAGNRRAFDHLYDKYWEQVYSAAYKRLQNDDISKDITQDIFINLWVKRESLKIDNLPAYLFVAVRNRVYNHFNRSHSFHPVDDLLADLSASGDQADNTLLTKEFFRAYELVRKAMPENQQKILQMRFTDGLDTDTIANQLNISKKTVQNQISIIINRMRSTLSSFIFLIFLIK